MFADAAVQHADHPTVQIRAAQALAHLVSW
eukprot:COSAG02_NODE_54110_length_298_cov_0.522613_1_plen_29_part_01